MISEEEKRALSSKYFEIFVVDDYDVVLKSRNTGHYWVIRCTGELGPQSVIIFHKHHLKDEYHLHEKTGSLQEAIRRIQGHDRFQLNGRKRVRRRRRKQPWEA